MTKRTSPLSRTTRSRFLRRLALEINVEKHSFNQQSLVAFTDAFSKEFDFGIDPLAFVGSFLDCGILHFEHGKVRFSLPFIEAYLLAVELSTAPTKALSYFDPSQEHFDLNAFDLYSEIGASADVVNQLMRTLEASLTEFEIPEGTRNLLLTDRITPSLLKNRNRLEAVQNRLRQTADDVLHGRGDTKTKQRLLDVADRVREAAADKSKSIRSEEADPRTEEQRKVGAAVQSWVIGTTLLGAGAEHLGAETKQHLASTLVKLAAVMMHHWTTAHAAVDFKTIKAELTKDDAIKEIASTGEADFEEVRRQIKGIVDLLEFSFVSEPCRRILHHLCEGARQRVLATSVEKATVIGTMDSIIHAAWLTDIDFKRGITKLLASMKELPNSIFLRTVLTTHFLLRVYWSHWSQEHRLALLDAAAEALKPIASLKKGELKRLIEQSADNSNSPETMDSDE